MKMIILTILSNFLGLTNSLPEHPDCIDGCSYEYKDVNMTEYTSCLEQCCVQQSRSFTALFIILAMFTVGVGYYTYTRRKSKNDYPGYTSDDYYSRA